MDRATSWTVVTLLWFATPTLAQTELWHADGDANQDAMGESSAAIGDLNGDGVPDALAGATGGNGVGPNSGWVRALSGCDGTTLWTVRGSSHSEGLGISVARIDDLDGDGVDDVLAGGFRSTPSAPFDGVVRILSGATGSQIDVLNGTTPSERFGFCVVGIHDWNGDGTQDFAVGAPGRAAVGSSMLPGRVVVYSGADRSVLHEWQDLVIDGSFGWSVSGTGDTNQDGVPDVVIGSPGTFFGVSPRVFLYSGVDGAELWSLTSTSSDRAGYSVSGIEDVDGDARADVVVGAPASSGRVRILSGASGSTIHLLENMFTGRSFGWSVDGSEDIDGDGTADVLVGAPSHVFNAVSSFSVFSGDTGAWLGGVEIPPPGDQWLHFGWSVDVVGDLSGDGLPDILACAPDHPDGVVGTGRVRAYSLTLTPPPTVSVSCDPANVHYGGGSVDLGTSTLSPAGCLHLEATSGPAGEFGFFLVGSTANVTTPVFNGVLCLDGQVARYNANIASNQALPQLNSTGQFDGDGVLQNLSGTSTTGSGFDVPLELPFTPAQSIQPGESWSFQLWFRDQLAPLPNPGSTANFSNVVTVTFP